MTNRHRLPYDVYLPDHARGSAGIAAMASRLPDFEPFDTKDPRLAPIRVSVRTVGAAWLRLTGGEHHKALMKRLSLIAQNPAEALSAEKVRFHYHRQMRLAGSCPAHCPP